MVCGKAHKAHRGLVSLFVLVVMIFLAQLMAMLIRAVSESLEQQQFLFGAESRLLLIQSFCENYRDQPLVRPGKTLHLPEVIIMGQPLHLRLNSRIDRKQRFATEQITLVDRNGMPLLKARRFEVRVPGGPDHPLYAKGSSGGEPLPSYTLSDFTEYRQQAGPFPSPAQQDLPFKGELFSAGDTIPRVTASHPLAGRAVFLLPRGIKFLDGSRVSGHFVFYSFDDIYIGDQVNLNGVFLFTKKRIIVGENSHIHGIMTAGTSITWGSGSGFMQDEAVLQPFRTPYSML
jgi:hypothetical protein